MRTALILTLCLTATASWAVPFEGSWAVDQERCSKPNEGNIRIVAGSYFSHESECIIRNTTRRPIGYTLALDCKSRGEALKETIKLRTLAGGTKLVVNGSTLVRCKGGRQPPNHPTTDRASP